MTLRSTQIRKTEHRTRLKNSIDVSQILKVVIRYHSHLKDLSNCVKPAHQIWSVCSRTGAKCQMVPNPRTATEFCFSELVQALRLHAQRVTTSYERVRTTIRHAISDVLIDFTFTLCKKTPLCPDRDRAIRQIGTRISRSGQVCIIASRNLYELENRNNERTLLIYLYLQS